MLWNGAARYAKFEPRVAPAVRVSPEYKAANANVRTSGPAPAASARVPWFTINCKGVHAAIVECLRWLNHG